MSDRLEIKITGSNQSSAAFQQVTRDATQMGSAVEQSGQKASRSLQDFSVKSAAVGVAIGTATQILGEWSRAAAEDAANQARLQQAIENTGKSYDEYSSAVDKAIKAGQDKAFSDDATREALVRLNAVTNDTGASLDQLSLAMDFARAKGISLSDSAGIIAKVYGGNLGILSRYGIVLGENATATEALARIQQISAGQAATYASSDLGWLDKKKDKWAELTESIGGSTGELQQFLLLMPGLSAGVSAVTALGSGFLALGPIIAGVAAIAGGGYLLNDVLNNNTAGSKTSDSIFGNLGMFGADFFKKITPGSGGDAFFNSVKDQYGGVLDSNNLGDITNSLFYTPPGLVSNANPDDYAIGRLKASGVLPPTFDGNLTDAARYIQSQASGYGMSSASYVDRKIAQSGAYTYDPVTSQYVYKDTYTQLDRERRQLALPSVGANPGYGSMYQIAQGGGAYLAPKQSLGLQEGVTYREKHQAQSMASMGAASVANAPANVFARDTGDSVQTSMTAMGQQSVDIANNMTKALEKQYGAYAALLDGVMTTNDAQTAFNATQQSLSSEMTIYQSQASEWTSELSAQESAYEILQKRQQEGGQLTKEQTDFMNNYAQAVEIGTGAVEDSTVAAGIAAQNMLLNKNAMDTFKAGTDGVTEAILLLIETLGGVPDDVRTQITLDGAAEFESQLNAAINHLNNVNGQTATFYINTVQTGVAVGNPDGPSIDNNQYRLHGGIVGYANGGVVARMAEAGPELLNFRNGGSAWAMTNGLYNVPKGTYVTPAPASKLAAKAAPTGGIHISGPVYIYPATGDVQREFTAAIVGDWRG